MRREDDGSLNLSRLLAAVEASPPVSAVDVLARELAGMVGASAVSLLVPNFSGTALVRMTRASMADSAPAGADEQTAELPLDGSVHAEVLATQELHFGRIDGGWRALIPVTERGDVIGLLELSLPQFPEDDVVVYLSAAAHALAYVIVATRRHTDLLESARRDIPFSLAAEIQHRLLPSSYTVEGGPFTLAGWLEPAATVGGDTFDYSIDREYMYASLTDAVGHSNDAALLATLTVGSLRNTRRASASPADQAERTNEALHVGARTDQFVTGHIVVSAWVMALPRSSMPDTRCPTSCAAAWQPLSRYRRDHRSA